MKLRLPSLRMIAAGLGAVIVLVVALTAIFAPLLVPHDPFAQDLNSRLIPPAFMDGGRAGNFFGTDQLGRDYLSRLIYGARISMLIGVMAVVTSGLIGTTIRWCTMFGNISRSTICAREQPAAHAALT